MTPPAPTRIVLVPAGNVADAHGGGGTRNAGKIVVFRQPETVIARGLGMLCEVERIGECIGGSEAFADIGEVEYRELNHAPL